MSKWLQGTLLFVLVGCGSATEGATFNEFQDEPGAGTAGAPSGASGSGAGGSQPVGGSAGAPASEAGSAGAAEAGTGGTKGGSGPLNPQGGDANTSGAGGTLMQPQGGDANSSGMAGTGGVVAAGQPGTSGGGAGGLPATCSGPLPDLDCNDDLGDGCETSRYDHDNCGECGVKCGLSQKCAPGKATGAPVCVSK